MEAEQVDDERPKRSWNSSTKLKQARRPRSTMRTRQDESIAPPRRIGPGRSEGQTRRESLHSHSARRTMEETNDQQRLTRELLERAVSTAFGGLLQDSTLDVSAFPDVSESQSSGLSSVQNKENSPRAVVNPASKIEAKLRRTLEASASLSVNHRQRRREHEEVLQQEAEGTRTTREFQRRMKHAAFEHRERKLAVQSLQTRIQREIQFLVTTAADLEKREFLLDEAFESYEHALRLELGLAEGSCSSSKKETA